MKSKTQQEGQSMLQEALNWFVSLVTKREGGKSSVKIHQTRELLKVIDEELNGEVYPSILKLYKVGILGYKEEAAVPTNTEESRAPFPTAGGDVEVIGTMGDLKKAVGTLTGAQESSQPTNTTDIHQVYRQAMVIVSSKLTDAELVDFVNKYKGE